MITGVPNNSAGTNNQSNHTSSSSSDSGPSSPSVHSHHHPNLASDATANIPINPNLQVSPALLSATNWVSNNNSLHPNTSSRHLSSRRRRPRSPSPTCNDTATFSTKQESEISISSRLPKRQRRRSLTTMDDPLAEPPHSSLPSSLQGLQGTLGGNCLQAPIGNSHSEPSPTSLHHPSDSKNFKLDSLLKSFKEGLQAIGLNNNNQHVNGANYNGSISSSGHPRGNYSPWPSEISDISREELVRLLLQGMKEIGYPAAAMTLEAESGYSLDPSAEITSLRDNILSGNWNDVEDLLKREHLKSLEELEIFRLKESTRPILPNHQHQPATISKSPLDHWVDESLLGVDSEVLNVARFLVAQQKYLELLELGEFKKALVVLRRDLAPLASPTAEPLNPEFLLKVKSPLTLIDTSLNMLSVGGGAIPSEISGMKQADDEDPGVQRLCLLSSLMMCGSVEEIRERAMWSGSGSASRLRLLEDLQALIPPEKLLPHHRLSHLLEQSKTLQRLQCLYHVTNPPISLLSDHTCSRFLFPIQTSHVLSQHSDEVWRIEWDHCGTRLASAGKDTTCIIWKLTPVQSSNKSCNSSGSYLNTCGKGTEKFRGGLDLSNSPSTSARTRSMLWKALSTPAPTKSNAAPHLPAASPACDENFGAGTGEVTVSVHLILDGHPAGISCIAWSPDDSVLLTGSDCTIKMWNTRTGECIASLVKHEYEVSALSWLPDGQGFVSGAMDSDVLFWDLKGQNNFIWKVSPSRILDLAISPDGKKLVAIGIAAVNGSLSNQHNESISHDNRPNEGANGIDGTGVRNKQRRIHIFNIPEKKEDIMIPQTRELTCVSISDDSKYALINQSPNEVHLYSLESNCLIRRYVGQQQGEFVIRSCFGGLDRNFILSGSEDSKVYVWHKETGSLIEVLDGHGVGSVNSVAWNPKHPTMFASAGDDHTVRIWQAPGPNRPL